MGMGDSNDMLSVYRNDINAIDDELVKLFIKRMDTAGKIGAYKKQAGLPVLNVKREEEVKERLLTNVPDEYKESVSRLYDSIFSISRDCQSK